MSLRQPFFTWVAFSCAQRVIVVSGRAYDKTARSKSPPSRRYGRPWTPRSNCSVQCNPRLPASAPPTFFAILNALSTAEEYGQHFGGRGVRARGKPKPLEGGEGGSLISTTYIIPSVGEKTNVGKRKLSAIVVSCPTMRDLDSRDTSGL